VIKFRKDDFMAKNKNNNFKNSTSSSNSNTGSTGRSQSGTSMKDSHAQVPDKGPARSGPGGQ